METKTLYQLRRTSSLPTGKVAHSNIEHFNGLEIKYIGSCCDNIKKKDNRDFILVRQPGKSYYASNGSKLEWRIFYRSTGTSDAHSIRDGVWFPAYGWTLTPGGLLINKGLPYGYDKKGDKIQYYSGFGTPIQGLLQQFYLHVTSKLGYHDTLVINYYKNSYEKGEKSNLYFAPNSALNIGLLYEKNNDLGNAKIYFKKCLDMSGFRYEKSIHRKAILGLGRIKD